MKEHSTGEVAKKKREKSERNEKLETRNTVRISISIRGKTARDKI